MSSEAEIIAVGSELLGSSKLETNSLFLAERLHSLGVVVARKTVVGDRRQAISGTLSNALRCSDIVIVTGGLGPTSDDLTREAVAETLSRKLELDLDLLNGLQARYRSFGLRMTDNNRRQAMVPLGAEVLENPNGTAPGLFLQEGEKLVFLLPGPPRELNPMVDARVLPLIRKFRKTSERWGRQLRVASLGESAVDARIAPLYGTYPRIETTLLSSPGVIDVFFFWKGEEDRAEANRQLDELVGLIRREMGVAVFSEGPEDLEAVVGALLKSKGLQVATAESCTGGLIGKLLTNVSGSSEYYLGGVVSYSDALKVEFLGVRKRSLERFGAVSEAVAAEMAEGVCRLTGADLGLSATGIAGPTGGSEEKPVGLVYVGLADRRQTQVKKSRFPGDREAVRLRSARFALDWVRKHLL